MARCYFDHLFVERSEAISATLRAGLGDSAFGPPTWDDAKFTLNGDVVLDVNLHS
jgi:hypothetical protein